MNRETITNKEQGSRMNMPERKQMKSEVIKLLEELSEVDPQAVDEFVKYIDIEKLRRVLAKARERK